VPASIPVDWFYFPYFPLTALDPRLAWGIATVFALVVLAVPWLLRGAAPATARVETPACTGCTRCYKDCPYEAIVMVARTDGSRYKTQAVVNPARCVGCGICVGACDSGGIVLGDEPIGVLASAVTTRLAESRASGHDPILVYTCRLMASLEGHLVPVARAGSGHGVLRDVPGAVVMGLPCVGLIHPDLLGQAVAAGARGVYIAGCIPEDCQFREGSTWLAQRLAGARLPALRDAPGVRVGVEWYSPVERARFMRDLAAFARDLA
jgi:ferredoxin/coenzyme F420-reducing hydrogenase delta subunit